MLLNMTFELRYYVASDGRSPFEEWFVGALRMKGKEMALTKEFKELVQRRVASDPAFGRSLLSKAIEAAAPADREEFR